MVYGYCRVSTKGKKNEALTMGTLGNAFKESSINTDIKELKPF